MIKKKRTKTELPLNQIICDHNVRAMRRFANNSIDSILTDPPYGLNFMGKAWDSFGVEIPGGIAYSEKGLDFKAGVTGKAHSHGLAGHNPYEFQKWCTKWAKECLRVAKPGAFMFVFGGTRTFHRLTCAIEDAGWQIRDCLMWLYGSGFPKSLDISKVLMEKLGDKGKETGEIKHHAQKGVAIAEERSAIGGGAFGKSKDEKIKIPTHPLAQLWDGYGTALKPAWEPIIVAMKPLDGTFAQNAENWNVAGLNIDGGKIGTGDDKMSGGYQGKIFGSGKQAKTNYQQGRWPANLILDEEAARILDGQQEGVSRFFYCAKASKSERNAGLEGTEAKIGVGINAPRANEIIKTKLRQNNHPTVKPLRLMRYLCTLLKMPGKDQVILDPFVGSGTTCIACKELGINYIGIDNNKDYCEITIKRLKAVKATLFESLPKKKSKKKKVRESFGLCE